MLAFDVDERRALDSAGLHFLVDKVDAELGALRDAVDLIWVLHSASFVFFMQCGFAMLCAGCVRTKNTRNILLKNMLDACAGAIGFWSVGYGIAFGEGGNPFIGEEHFFMLGLTSARQLGHWVFQFGFAATAATIVSGAVAERTQMVAYLGYSALLTMFVYPVCAHWQWSRSGWLSPLNATPLLGCGLIDFSGDGCIHMLGGVCALIGAYVVGPRIGRYDEEGRVIALSGHSSTLQVLGALILWTGWYGFNPGSTIDIYGRTTAAAMAAVTTTIAAASGAMACLLIAKVSEHTFSLGSTINGTLAGLVSITAGCAVIEPGVAVFVGAVGGALFLLSSNVVAHVLKIDDVVDAFSVHYVCGAWGLLAASLFARQEQIAAAYGLEVNDVKLYGAFYAPIGSGHQLFGCAMIAVLCITAWTTAIMLPFFTLMKLFGLLRIPEEMELIGIDVSKHGGFAYPEGLIVVSPPPSLHGPSALHGATPRGGKGKVEPESTQVHSVQAAATKPASALDNSAGQMMVVGLGDDESHNSSRKLRPAQPGAAVQ
ncbi:hypothetical protein KFE25_009944 [Diacronema lutheri]|uniref:Ammonium transporter n=1 Tax=Diacronema lutheri TaxID=2081491 RepID=A0A8J5X9Y8_DIALT|nr:hypothetical protein KFE25_009944 [Diacronema lutheri]